MICKCCGSLQYRFSWHPKEEAEWTVCKECGKNFVICDAEAIAEITPPADILQKAAYNYGRSSDELARNLLNFQNT